MKIELKNGNKSMFFIIIITSSASGADLGDSSKYSSTAKNSGILS